LLAACGITDANEKFIQGKWTAAGDQGEGHSWYLEWTFDNGRFEMTGYPPIQQSGLYQIATSAENTLTLTMTEQQGDFGTEDSTLTILIDPDNNSLTIDNLGPFSRSE
jgi:hypothetical protein